MQTPGKIVHTYSDGRTLIFINLDGYAYPDQGDIIYGRIKDMPKVVELAEQKLSAITSQGIAADVYCISPECLLTGGRWSGRVPYIIDSKMSTSERKTVEEAIKKWNNKDVWIKLTPKTSRYEPYVVFKRTTSGGCSSLVGKFSILDESQPINLNSSCFYVDTIHHEIGHAVGLYYEHQRCDRNKFVTVYKTSSNYKRQCSAGDDYGPYNYDSMMHYNASLTSNTIRTKSRSNLNRLGYRKGVDYVGNPEGNVGGFSLGSYDIRTINSFYKLDNPPGWRAIKYRAHVTGKGWLSWVSNNSIAGTTGERRQMEAVRISVDGIRDGMGVEYKAHLKRIGWQNWASNGEIAGYVGENRQMEAIKIRLTGNSAGCSIKYRAHVAGRGWMSWVSNGSMAGTTGQGRRMEALQVQLNCN